jgi:hypothetical protein
MQRRTLVSKEDRTLLPNKDSGFQEEEGVSKKDRGGEIDQDNDMGFSRR